MAEDPGYPDSYYAATALDGQAMEPVALIEALEKN